MSGHARMRRSTDGTSPRMRDGSLSTSNRGLMVVANPRQRQRSIESSVMSTMSSISAASSNGPPMTIQIDGTSDCEESPVIAATPVAHSPPSTSALDMNVRHRVSSSSNRSPSHSRSNGVRMVPHNAPTGGDDGDAPRRSASPPPRLSTTDSAAADTGRLPSRQFTNTVHSSSVSQQTSAGPRPPSRSQTSPRVQPRVLRTYSSSPTAPRGRPSLINPRVVRSKSASPPPDGAAPRVSFQSQDSEVGGQPTASPRGRSPGPPRVRHRPGGGGFDSSSHTEPVRAGNRHSLPQHPRVRARSPRGVRSKSVRQQRSPSLPPVNDAPVASAADDVPSPRGSPPSTAGTQSPSLNSPAPQPFSNNGGTTSRSPSHSKVSESVGSATSCSADSKDLSSSNTFSNMIRQTTRRLGLFYQSSKSSVRSPTLARTTRTHTITQPGFIRELHSFSCNKQHVEMLCCAIRFLVQDIKIHERFRKAYAHELPDVESDDDDEYGQFTAFFYFSNERRDTLHIAWDLLLIDEKGNPLKEGELPYVWNFPKPAIKFYMDICQYVQHTDIVEGGHLISQARRELQKLKSLDARRMTRDVSPTGFVNAFDNYLCALMTNADDFSLHSEISIMRVDSRHNIPDAPDRKQSDLAKPGRKRSQKTSWTHVLLAFLSVIASCGSLFFIWHFITTSTLDHLINQMGSEVQNRSEAIIQSMFVVPPMAAQLAQVAWITGEFGNHTDFEALAASTALDAYFIDLMSEFQVSGIMLGTAGGRFVGMFDYFSEDEGQFISTYDPDEGDNGCFVRYDIDKETKARLPDTRRLTDGDTGCTQTVLNRDWWTLAASNNTPDWTDVYEYVTGSLGVTHVFPIYENDEILAVWAVDMELDHLDAQLQEITIPNDGVVYIMNRDGEGRVIASSVPDGDSRHLIDDTSDQLRGGVCAHKKFVTHLNLKSLSTASLEGGNKVSARRLDFTQGLDVLAVTVFETEDYLRNVEVADTLTAILSAVALVCVAVLSHAAMQIEPTLRQDIIDAEAKRDEEQQVQGKFGKLNKRQSSKNVKKKPQKSKNLEKFTRVFHTHRRGSKSILGTHGKSIDQAAIGSQSLHHRLDPTNVGGSNSSLLSVRRKSTNKGNSKQIPASFLQASGDSGARASYSGLSSGPPDPANTPTNQLSKRSGRQKMQDHVKGAISPFKSGLPTIPRLRRGSVQTPDVADFELSESPLPAASPIEATEEVKYDDQGSPFQPMSAAEQALEAPSVRRKSASTSISVPKPAPARSRKASKILKAPFKSSDKKKDKENKVEMTQLGVSHECWTCGTSFPRRADLRKHQDGNCAGSDDEEFDVSHAAPDSPFLADTIKSPKKKEEQGFLSYKEFVLDPDAYIELNDEEEPGGVSKEAAKRKMIVEAALADDRRVKKNTKYIYVIYVSTLLIIGCLVAISALWGSNSKDASTLISDTLIDETQSRIEFTITDYLGYSPRINMVTKNRFTRLGLNINDTELFRPPGVDETYDRYFYGLMQALRGYQDQETEVPQFLSEFVYIGFANGDVIGSFRGRRHRDDAINDLFIGARDAFSPINPLDPTETIHCYREYNALADGRRDFDSPYHPEDPDDCEYDPRERPWYKKALVDSCVNDSDDAPGMWVASDDGTWSDTYIFSIGVPGLTATRSLFNNPDTTFASQEACQEDIFGVLAADLSLEFLRTFLSDVTAGSGNETDSDVRDDALVVRLNTTDNKVLVVPEDATCEDDEPFAPFGETFLSRSEDFVFIVERQSQILVSASAGSVSQNITSDGGETIRLFLYANQSDSEEIRDAALYLNNRQIPRNNRSVVENLVDVTVPAVVNRSLEDPLTYVRPLTAHNLDWVSVVMVSRSSFLNRVENNETLTLLLVLGALMLIVYVAGNMYRSWTRTGTWRQRRDALEGLGDVELDNVKVLETLTEKIRSEVESACQASWSLRVNNHQDDFYNGIPIMATAYTNHFMERALSHIKEAEAGQNILTQFELEQHGVWPARLYRIQKNALYSFLIHAVVIAHILLAFEEPPDNESLQNLEQPIATEVWGLWIAEIVLIIFESTDLAVRIFLKRKYKIENFLVPHNEELILHTRALVIFLVFFDWILTVSSQWSFEYYAPTRPFLLILMNARIRTSAWTFLKSMYAAKNVFVLYFCLVVVAAVNGLHLFRNNLNEGEFDSTFENFIRSMVTAFVFISTGENYTEVVYGAYDENPWFMLYFVVLALFGMFLVIGMVTGFFELGFTQMQKEELRLRKLFNRTGIVAAFVLLDSDGSGEINEKEFREFISHIRKDVNKKEIQDLFNFMNQADDFKQKEASLDVNEFVTGVEEVSISRLTSPPREPKNRWLRYVKQKVIDSQIFDQFVLFTVILQIMLMSLYGLYEDIEGLDYALIALLFWMVVEVMLRFFAIGPVEYWNWAKYHDPGLFKMYALRSDILIVSASFLGYLWTRVEYNRLDFGDDDPGHIFRFFMCLPILRIFTQVQRTRYLVFTLFQVIPAFLSVLVLLLTVFYAFGIIGTNAFFDKYVKVAFDPPEANFQSLGNSMLTLFQLTVGEGWHEVMYDTIRVTSWTHAWYFITFVLIISLLFTNLFIGLVLSVFSTILKTQNKNPKDKKHKELTRKELDKIIEKL